MNCVSTEIISYKRTKKQQNQNEYFNFVCWYHLCDFIYWLTPLALSRFGFQFTEFVIIKQRNMHRKYIAQLKQCWFHSPKVIGWFTNFGTIIWNQSNDTAHGTVLFLFLFLLLLLLSYWYTRNQMPINQTHVFGAIYWSFQCAPFNLSFNKNRTPFFSRSLALCLFLFFSLSLSICDLNTFFIKLAGYSIERIFCSPFHLSYTIRN